MPHLKIKSTAISSMHGTEVSDSKLKQVNTLS